MRSPKRVENILFIYFFQKGCFERGRLSLVGVLKFCMSHEKREKAKESSVDVLVMVRDRVVSDEESSPRYDAP